MHDCFVVCLMLNVYIIMSIISLTVNIKDVFASVANWLEMIKHCLAILFPGRDSRCIQNLIILNKIFNFKESRPVSLRATTLGALLLRPRKYL